MARSGRATGRSTAPAPAAAATANTTAVAHSTALAGQGEQAPSLATPDLLELQRQAGNRAVVKLLATGAGSPPPPVQRKKGKGGAKGPKKYVGGPLHVKLRQMQAAGTLVHKGKPLTLSESDIFLLQSVANVESSGQVAGINVWDNMVVSMGFKQVVLVHGSLYDVIRMVPSAFARHGISIGTGQYTFTIRGKTIKQPSISGADDPAELRKDPWPARFLEAGLDEEIISALVVYALEDERELYGKVAKSVGKQTHPHMNDPTVRAWLFEAYNNRPDFARKAAISVIRQTTGKQVERDAFLDIVAEAIRVEYRKRPDKPERGGNEEWKANNIIKKISRSGQLRGGKAPPRIDPVVSKPAASGPPPSGDLLKLLLGTIGTGLASANRIAAMLGLPDLGSWLQSGGLDSKTLTNIIFFARHPELNGRRIRSDETELAQEWLRIRDKTVAPFLRDVARKPPASTSGSQAQPATGTPASAPEPAAPSPKAAPAAAPASKPAAAQVPAAAPPGAAPGAADPGGQRAFVLDAMRNTMELLPKKERERFEGMEWGWLDYPGSKSKPISEMSAEELARYRRDTALVEHKGGYFVGKHQKQADELFLALARVRPGGGERRVVSGDSAVLTSAVFATSPAAYEKYVRDQLQPLAGQGSGDRKKMNKHAAAAFATMRAAAKQDGVVLKVGNAFRDFAVAAAAAKKAGNPKAVGGISHSIGLAMDLNLWTQSMAPTGKEWTEQSTGNFKNLLRMTSSPAYKWMFMRGADFGFYQYRPEPWHWEYNPPGFKKKFFADAPAGLKG